MVIHYRPVSCHESLLKEERGLGSAASLFVIRMSVIVKYRRGEGVFVESVQDDGFGCVCDFEIWGCGEGAESVECNCFCVYFSYVISNNISSNIPSSRFSGCVAPSILSMESTSVSRTMSLMA